MEIGEPMRAEIGIGGGLATVAVSGRLSSGRRAQQARGGYYKNGFARTRPETTSARSFNRLAERYGGTFTLRTTAKVCSLRT
jgi:hypothetical protein